MTHQIKILLTEFTDTPEAALLALAQVGEVTKKDIQAAELPWAFAHFDVFWLRMKFKITEELLRMPNRRTSIIVCPFTGLDHIDRETCDELGIQVISLGTDTELLKDVRSTAELTMGLTLALMRKIPQASASVKAGEWYRAPYKGADIVGKTVGIIGVGRLGKMVAHCFQAFGAQVQGYGRSLIEASGVRQIDSLEKLVATSDIISIHIGYDESTHHLVDEALLSHFKKGAFLINTSRGAVIDSNALIKALENDWLAGAALDVIENEYDVSKSTLIAYAKTHDNLLITPHIGGFTTDSFAKTDTIVAHKLIALLNHETVDAS